MGEGRKGDIVPALGRGNWLMGCRVRVHVRTGFARGAGHGCCWRCESDVGT